MLNDPRSANRFPILMTPAPPLSGVLHLRNTCVVLHSVELCAGVGMLGEGVRAACELLGIEHRTVCYVEREAAAG